MDVWMHIRICICTFTLCMYLCMYVYMHIRYWKLWIFALLKKGVLTYACIFWKRKGGGAWPFFFFLKNGMQKFWKIGWIWWFLKNALLFVYGRMYAFLEKRCFLVKNLFVILWKQVHIHAYIHMYINIEDRQKEDDSKKEDKHSRTR